MITEIDGAKTPNGTALLDVVANSPVGKTIRVKVNRDGKEMTIPVTIVDRQEILSRNAPVTVAVRRTEMIKAVKRSQAKLGIRVQALTPDMVRQLRLNSRRTVCTYRRSSRTVSPKMPASSAERSSRASLQATSDARSGTLKTSGVPRAYLKSGHGCRVHGPAARSEQQCSIGPGSWL